MKNVRSFLKEAEHSQIIRKERQVCHAVGQERDTATSKTSPDRPAVLPKAAANTLRRKDVKKLLSRHSTLSQSIKEAKNSHVIYVAIFHIVNLVFYI